MSAQEDFFKKALTEYFKTELGKILPEILRETIKGNDLFIGQEFVPIKNAMLRYGLSRKTIYNYHNRGHITLHTSDGKTFVSIRDLEAYIRRNSLARISALKE